VDPYRDGKPIADLIPPDRRRAKVAVIVVASMFAGAYLYALASRGVEVVTSPPPPPAPPPSSTHIAPVVLTGPDGSVSLPSGKVTIVHVWLEGCADCMPAFRAMRDLQDKGGFGLDAAEVNVSFGKADPAWASRFGVRTNLVHDLGGQSVVRPLGISTFTTLVVDPGGAIAHKDRPDEEGYLDRVRTAVKTLQASQGGAGPSLTLSAQAIEDVTRARTAALRRFCWEQSGKGDTADVSVKVSIRPDGRVGNIDAQGSDPEVTRCVSRAVETWRFPASRAGATATIPLHFVRQ
jgi:thiol-disulfide isomerase/thioredoxin